MLRRSEDGEADPGYNVDVLGFLSGAVGAGLASLLMAPYRRRRFIDPVGGRAQAKLFRTALRRGRVPGQADRSRWRQYVDTALPPAARRRGRTWLLSLPLVVLLLILLAVVSGFLAASQRPHPEASSPPGLLAVVVPLVLLVLALGLVAWSHRQRVRRLERLQQRLGDDR